MQTNTSTIISSPPRVFKSFALGFEKTANNLPIVLIPLLLDIFLWFGPRLRIFNLLQPTIDQITSRMFVAESQEYLNMAKATQELWQYTLGRFNLFSSLSTLPVGVPSLLAPDSPIANPLGISSIFELASVGVALMDWILIVIIGIILGSIFYNQLALLSQEKKFVFDPSKLLWQTAQSVLLALTLLLLVIILLLPLTMVSTILVLFSPAVGQISILLGSILLVWLLLPLFFAPHGIFTLGITAIKSMLVSLRLVKTYLTGTSLFVLVSLLLNQGLNMLWKVPPETSWMTIVGIAGHAYVSTSLAEAGFIYFVGGLKWLNSNSKEAAPSTENTRPQEEQ